MAPLLLHLDLACPWSWLAAVALERAAERLERPIHVAPVRMIDLQDRPPARSPARRRAEREDLLRRASLLRTRIQPPDRPGEREDAGMAALAAAPEALRWPLARALLRARWREGERLAPAVIERERQALDTQRDPRALAPEPGQQALDAERGPQTPDPGPSGPPSPDWTALAAQARARGVFAVPTVTVGEAVHYGSDRIDVLERELGGSPPALPAHEGDTLPVALHFDFADPEAFLISPRVERLCGRGVSWHPASSASLQAASGDVETRPARWLRADLLRQADDAGLPLNLDAPPCRTQLALRAVLLAGTDDDEGRLLIHHLLHGRWVRGADLADPAVLAELAGEAGFDGGALVAAARGDGGRQALRAANEAALAAGLHRLPTLVVAGQRFVGSDRLEDAARACRIRNDLVTIGSR